jgi:hypothetical protein
LREIPLYRIFFYVENKLSLEAKQFAQFWVHNVAYI